MIPWIVTHELTLYTKSQQESRETKTHPSNVLFRKKGNCWIRQEVDYRRKWKTAGRILESFINNNKEVTYSDGTKHQEKVALSKAVKPKTDNLCTDGNNNTSSGGTCK